MSTLILKQHDLEPAVNAQLKNLDGSAINLTTATGIFFILRPAGGGTTIRKAATVVTAAPDFEADPTAYHVRYAWVSGDTATVNVYDQEWEITWPTARPQTVPNHNYNTLIIEDDLD